VWEDNLSTMGSEKRKNCSQTTRPKREKENNKKEKCIHTKPMGRRPKLKEKIRNQSGKKKEKRR